MSKRKRRVSPRAATVQVGTGWQGPASGPPKRALQHGSLSLPLANRVPWTRALRAGGRACGSRSEPRVLECLT